MDQPICLTSELRQQLISFLDEEMGRCEYHPPLKDRYLYLEEMRQKLSGPVKPNGLIGAEVKEFHYNLGSKTTTTVKLQPEVVCAGQPARVSLLFGRESVIDIVATVESQEGADGNRYPAVKLTYQKAW